MVLPRPEAQAASPSPMETCHCRTPGAVCVCVGMCVYVCVCVCMRVYACVWGGIYPLFRPVDTMASSMSAPINSSAINCFFLPCLGRVVLAMSVIVCILVLWHLELTDLGRRAPLRANQFLETVKKSHFSNTNQSIQNPCPLQPSFGSQTLDHYLPEFITTSLSPQSLPASGLLLAGLDPAWPTSPVPSCRNLSKALCPRFPPTLLRFTNASSVVLGFKFLNTAGGCCCFLCPFLVSTNQEINISLGFG